MSWGIVFIIIAVAMAVGPIMMFKPSSRLRHLEALRAEAAASGLKIRTVNYESRNQQQTIIVYSQRCETPFDVFVLQRHDISHDIHFYHQWDWQGNNPPEFSKSQTQSLINLINRLPETVIGVEFSPDSVGLWWQEKSVDQWGMPELKAALIDLNNIVISD